MSREYYYSIHILPPSPRLYSLPCRAAGLILLIICVTTSQATQEGAYNERKYVAENENTVALRLRV